VNTYYKLEDDVTIPGRWYLNGLSDSAGVELDSRDLTYGLPVEIGPPVRVSLRRENTIIAAHSPLRVSLRRKGKPLDFTFADFDMPVVTERVAVFLSSIDHTSLQRLPVHVGSLQEKYEIVNVVSCLPCIDPVRSMITWWTDADERPDKIGSPRMITDLRIDRTRVHNCHVFRPEGWLVALIVSDVVKHAFEEAQVSGVKFLEV
jgi:hypothetical protein